MHKISRDPLTCLLKLKSISHIFIFLHLYELDLSHAKSILNFSREMLHVQKGIYRSQSEQTQGWDQHNFFFLMQINETDLQLQ